MIPKTTTNEFTTGGGVLVRCKTEPETYQGSRLLLVDTLDSHRGILLSSDFEYPGRYTRWDMGFVDPPLELSAIGRSAKISALNNRGKILIEAVSKVLPHQEYLSSYKKADFQINFFKTSWS